MREPSPRWLDKHSNSDSYRRRSGLVVQSTAVSTTFNQLIALPFSYESFHIETWEPRISVLRYEKWVQGQVKAGAVSLGVWTKVPYDRR